MRHAAESTVFTIKYMTNDWQTYGDLLTLSFTLLIPIFHLQKDTNMKIMLSIVHMLHTWHLLLFTQMRIANSVVNIT